MIETAAVFNEPWNSTRASLVARDSNLFGAVLKVKPVSLETYSAMASAKPIYVFNPVPTAVPPCASSDISGILASILRIACFI